MADKGHQGFAGMDEERQREIASEGGHASHEKGAAHEFSSEEAAEAGRKGAHARAVSGANRESAGGGESAGRSPDRLIGAAVAAPFSCATTSRMPTVSAHGPGPRHEVPAHQRRRH